MTERYQHGESLNLTARARLVRRVAAPSTDVESAVRRLEACGEAALARHEVNALVASALRAAMADLKRVDIIVEAALRRDLPCVWAEPRLVGFVLEALVQNAAHAMATAARRRLIVVTELDGDGDVRVLVRDTGNAATVEHRIRRVAQPIGGVPDGLSRELRLCQWIIARHGGCLWAGRNRDGGATFAFSLRSYRTGAHPADEPAAGRLLGLSAREREVLEHVVAGTPGKVIAQHLNISARTVEFHRARLKEKLSAGSLAELIRMAMAAGVSPRYVGSES